MAGNQKFATRVELKTSDVKGLPTRNQIYEVPDNKVIGLRVIVYPSGQRSFGIRYVFNGRNRKHVLGPFPRLKLTDARRLAANKLRDVHAGVDPGRLKADAIKAAKSGTVAMAFAEFDVDHLAKKKSAREQRRIFKRYVLPRIGQRPLVLVGKSDVIDILKGIQAPAMSNRTYSALSKFFKWASAYDLIPVPPTIGVAKLHAEAKPRDRTLSDQEIRWYWQAASELGVFGALYKTLLVSGMRLGEAAALKWDDIDWQQRLISFEGRRMKNGNAHKIYLSKLLESIIDPIKPAGDYVFGGDRPPSGFSKAKKRLDAEMTRIAKEEFEQPAKPFVIHDARRTFRTGLGRLGVSPEIAERCIAHSSGPSFEGVKGIYNRWGYPTEMERAFKGWADHLAKIVDK